MSNPERIFQQILAPLDDDDYERCETVARDFLSRPAQPAEKLYRPYAKYFMIFAQAYRAWQISYHYTKIRSRFQVAHDTLERDLARDFTDEVPADHALLIESFGLLSGMLCAYTWCENSFINNDPAALARHSAAALEYEDKALGLLADRRPADPVLALFADWLADYFRTNRFLHEGLNACALIYERIFETHQCPETFFRENIERAERALEALAPITAELASELNAHIVHVRRHWERLAAQPAPTFLRVRQGKLVLALEAACDRGVVRDILNDQARFRDGLSRRYAELKIEAANFRRDHLHDIFETSFGAYFLQALSFDLPAIRLSFAEDRSYLFRTHVTMSSLGVCTLFFTLPLEETAGLGVEEIRMLQSCITPHAGQVKVLLEDPEDSDYATTRLFCLASHLANFDIIERMDLASLRRNIQEIQQLLQDRRLARHAPGLSETIEDLVQCWCAPATEAGAAGANPAALNEDSPKFDHALRELVTRLSELAEDPAAPETARAVARGTLRRLVQHCEIYTSLVHLARLFLNPIEETFHAIATERRTRRPRKNHPAAPPNPEHHWMFRPDTGWYTYLYATGIDEETAERVALGRRVGFDTIEKHPDTLGLIIEQREARASFDDWRFMDIKYDKEPNLAGVRSHDTDAFFISEYQSFFYFPDDPQFLTDQYEATVELMNRLNAAMRFYNHVAQELSHKVLDQLGRVKSGSMSEDGEAALRASRDAIRMLRSEAGEIQNLISKADVSRYKDHGDLMALIIQKMKLDKVCQLLDRHLNHLDDLHSYIINGLEEEAEEDRARNEKKIDRRMSLLSGLFGATAIGGLSNAVFKIDFIANLFKNNPQAYWTKDGAEGLATLTLILLFFGWMFFLEMRKSD